MLELVQPEEELTPWSFDTGEGILYGHQVRSGEIHISSLVSSGIHFKFNTTLYSSDAWPMKDVDFIVPMSIRMDEVKITGYSIVGDGVKLTLRRHGTNLKTIVMAFLIVVLRTACPDSEGLHYHVNNEYVKTPLGLLALDEIMPALMAYP